MLRVTRGILERRGIEARAQLTPVSFDRDADLEPQLRLLSPDVVIDASGPFQAYGNDT